MLFAYYLLLEVKMVYLINIFIIIEKQSLSPIAVTLFFNDVTYTYMSIVNNVYGGMAYIYHL